MRTLRVVHQLCITKHFEEYEPRRCPDPLAQLTEIRAIMERRSRCLSLSGPSGVGAAVAALACAASVLLLGYVNQPHLKRVLYALLTAANGVAQA